LDGSGIDAVVGQLEPAGMAQHVRVNLHIEASGLPLHPQERVLLRQGIRVIREHVPKSDA
jgi:hypothetical protein